MTAIIIISIIISTLFVISICFMWMAMQEEPIISRPVILWSLREINGWVNYNPVSGKMCIIYATPAEIWKEENPWSMDYGWERKCTMFPTHVEVTDESANIYSFQLPEKGGVAKLEKKYNLYF